MKIIAGTLGLTLLGAIVGAGLGWLGNPRPSPTPEAGLEFTNYVGSILGGALGATFGLMVGGPLVAKAVSEKREKQ